MRARSRAIMRHMREGEAPESFPAGTLAGAGCFRCGTCGFAVALHECDEVPRCSHCGGTDFKRSSMFGELSLREPVGGHEPQPPSWLEETRDALERAGSYLAYEDGGRLRVVELAEGWTRIGRSLSADIRFDDPTVSRRHALVHTDGETVRILDDRSLNGVFVDGEHVDMRELSDGDDVSIGRFRLYFLQLAGDPYPRPRFRLRSAVG